MSAGRGDVELSVRSPKPVAYLQNSEDADGLSDSPGLATSTHSRRSSCCTSACVGTSSALSTGLTLGVLAFLIAMYLKLDEIAKMQQSAAAQEPLELIRGDVYSTSSSSSADLWYTREFPRGDCLPMTSSFLDLNAIDINGTNRSMSMFREGAECLEVLPAHARRCRSQ